MSGGAGTVLDARRRTRRAGAVGGAGLAIALWSPAALIAGMGGPAFASLLMCGVGPLMWAVGEGIALKRLETRRS